MNKLLVVGVVAVVAIVAGLAYYAGRSTFSIVENEETITFNDWANRDRKIEIHRRIKG